MMIDSTVTVCDGHSCSLSSMAPNGESSTSEAGRRSLGERSECDDLIDTVWTPHRTSAIRWNRGER